MISFLRGSVYRCRETVLDVDVQGVGYAVYVPERLLMEMTAGESIFLYTYHHVREDAQQLFGFTTEAEREWFELLINVTGIGPKGALQIVSACEADVFYFAIASEDLAGLCKLPGIGKKTAQRLILELKDKIQHHPQTIEALEIAPGNGQLAGGSRGVRGEVIEALKMLGYNEKQAHEAASSVLKEDGDLTVEAVLKRCLQNLDTSNSNRRKLV